MVVQERHTAPVGDRVGFFARNDEYGEAARRNGGRGPRKVPVAFGQSPKAAGTFRGPLPSFLRAASPYPSFRAKKPTRSPTGAVCRSGTRLPVHSRASPHPEGKAVRLFRISSTRHRHLAGRGQGAKRPCRCDQQRNPRVSGGTWGNPDRTSAASGPDNTDSRFRRRSGGSGGRRRGCSRRVRHRGRATPYTL